MPVNPVSVFHAALAGLSGLVWINRLAHHKQALAWERGLLEAHPAARRRGPVGSGVLLPVGRAQVHARLLSFAAPLADGSTALEVAVPAALPAGMTIGAIGAWGFGRGAPIETGRAYLDAVFHVTADDGVWARAVLAHEDVAPELRRLHEDVGSVGLSEGRLRLVVPRPLAPDEVLALGRRVAALASAMGRGGVARWREAAQVHGLKLQIEGPLEMNLTGPPDAPPGEGTLALAFRATSWQDPGRQVLRFAVPGLPRGLHLLPRGPEDPPGPPLGDPILDRGLRVEGQPPGTAARLATDAVRGPLLDFLHGPHEPRVVEGHLALRAEGGAAPVLLEGLDEVRALARILGAAWR